MHTALGPNYIDVSAPSSPANSYYFTVTATPREQGANASPNDGFAMQIRVPVCIGTKPGGDLPVAPGTPTPDAVGGC